jgi:hypothetical protein
MRRIQANLTYLAAASDRMYKPPDKMPAQPAIMDSLPQIPGNTIPEAQLQTLQNLYKELKDLFPGAASKAPVSAGSGAPAVNGAPMGMAMGMGMGMPGNMPGHMGHAGMQGQQAGAR